MESKSFIMDKINDVIREAEKNDQAMDEEAVIFKKKNKNKKSVFKTKKINE